MADTKLIIRILTDAKNASKGFGDASKDAKGFNDTMASMAAPAGIAIGAIAALGTQAVNSASELQQSMGGVDAVFGDSADEIIKWGETSAQTVGLAQSEYQNFATVIGSQLKNLGVPMDQVAGSTDDLITLGADLAATYGGSTQDAVNALSSALRGEADPAEKYGLALNATTVNAELAAQGLTGLEGEAESAAKAQAIMKLASEQAAGAVGQFGREADTVAGQTQRANAEWENASAALGESLLPILTPIIENLSKMAQWVAENSGVITVLVAIIGALAAAVVAYTAVQAVLNAVMLANPIVLVVTAVVALIAGFALLIVMNEDVRKAFINGWEQIVSFFKTVWSGIKSGWDAVVGAFKNGLNQIKGFFTTIFNGIKSTVTNVFNAIKGIVTNVTGFFKSAWKGAVDAVNAVLGFFEDVAINALNAILGPIQTVVGWFNNIVDAIRTVIDWLGRIKIPDLGAIGNLFSGGKSATLAVTAPAAFSGRGLTTPTPTAMGGGGGAGIVINVQGGLDSADTIARRIEQLLASRARRTGGVTLHRSIR